MPSVQNKTFDEIKLGDTASVQRTLQARDVRAWAAAFGDVGPLAEAGDLQGTAGIVTGSSGRTCVTCAPRATNIGSIDRMFAREVRGGKSQPVAI